jgi:hypothetical protein
MKPNQEREAKDLEILCREYKLTQDQTNHVLEEHIDAWRYVRSEFTKDDLTQIQMMEEEHGI